MIVSEVMTTRLVTVTPDDTLSHAANLLRQQQFHHLPVVRGTGSHNAWGVDRLAQSAPPILEGLITSQDIDLAAAAWTEGPGDAEHSPWEERRVSEVMHRSIIRVTPTTSVAAAAQMLVGQGLNCLPVVEYVDAENMEQLSETANFLVGVLTRSDLLVALARTLGAFEPGMELLIPLPAGDLTPLARLLLLAAELHVRVQSVIVAPPRDSALRVATVRLGTINPGPLLVRLQEANVSYKFADLQSESDTHAS